MTGFWLITYEVSRDHRVSWNTYNDAINYPPAEWLIRFYRDMKRIGYTNVTLLSAMEVTKEQHDELAKVIEA